MKEYFEIQKTMAIRFLRKQGIHPVISVLLIFFVFVALSMFIFFKVSFAIFIYPFFCLILIERLNILERNDFLKSLFSEKEFYKIKILENVSIALPFSLFLIYKMEWLFVGLPILIAVVYPFLGLSRYAPTKTLPTPFYKYPFEFLVGFRKLWFLYPLFIGLLIVSIYTDNVNIGLFVILIYHLTVGAFYSKPEDVFYVQIFSCNAKRFLLRKIKTSLLYSIGLSIPITLTLLFFYPNEFPLIIGFYIWGITVLILLVISKYIVFPHQMTISQSIMLMFSIALAPLLIFTLPYFYNQAIKHLNNYL